MPYMHICGGEPLCGELQVQGSKNAALPVMAAALLIDGVTTLTGCPRISDVYDMLGLMELLGCKTSWKGSSVVIDATNINNEVIVSEQSQRSRSVVYFMGAMLSRTGRVTIPFPGGCTIGARPIDFHIETLGQMNADFEEYEDENGMKLLSCSTSGLKAASVCFVQRSVGATQNMILAAVCTEGVTTIAGAACEPEVTALCDFLRKAGAKIEGDGSSLITIRGVKVLRPVRFKIPGDRIAAGTYLAAAAAAGGEIRLTGISYVQLEEPVKILLEMGCHIKSDKDVIELKRRGRLRAVNLIETKPYPGFPTDLQSQFMAALVKAQGISYIYENIFEARYKTVPELAKLGADIEVYGRIAVVNGVKHTHGAQVAAWDLRGGAALVIAGLAAEGETVVYNIDFIERGYEDMCMDLTKIGAKAKRGL